MVVNFAFLVFGLVFTFIPDAVLSSGFGLFSGQSWSDLVLASPKTAEFILLTAGRMFGVHILVLTVLSFAIVLKGFRRGESWAWYANLIVLPGMIFDTVAVSIIGELPVVFIDIVVILLICVALGISAKDMLRKKST
jgi:hypothetical protein